ncbi:unnamed protein product [Choristocarpus tenellus]
METPDEESRDLVRDGTTRGVGVMEDSGWGSRDKDEVDLGTEVRSHQGKENVCLGTLHSSNHGSRTPCNNTQKPMSMAERFPSQIKGEEEWEETFPDRRGGTNEGSKEDNLLRLLVCSFNVGNSPLEDLSPWIPAGGEGFDLIVIGLQESTYKAPRQSSPLPHLEPVRSPPSRWQFGAGGSGLRSPVCPILFSPLDHDVKSQLSDSGRGGNERPRSCQIPLFISQVGLTAPPTSLERPKSLPNPGLFSGAQLAGVRKMAREFPRGITHIPRSFNSESSMSATLDASEVGVRARFGEEGEYATVEAAAPLRSTVSAIQGPQEGKKPKGATPHTTTGSTMSALKALGALSSEASSPSPSKAVPLSVQSNHRFPWEGTIRPATVIPRMPSDSSPPFRRHSLAAFGSSLQVDTASSVKVVKNGQAVAGVGDGEYVVGVGKGVVRAAPEGEGLTMKGAESEQQSVYVDDGEEEDDEDDEEEEEEEEEAIKVFSPALAKGVW